MNIFVKLLRVISLRYITKSSQLENRFRYQLFRKEKVNYNRYFNPLTKLGEGNVFTGVYLSIGGGYLWFQVPSARGWVCPRGMGVSSGWVCPIGGGYVQGR